MLILEEFTREGRTVKDVLECSLRLVRIVEGCTARGEIRKTFVLSRTDSIRTIRYNIIS